MVRMEENALEDRESPKSGDTDIICAFDSFGPNHQERHRKYAELGTGAAYDHYPWPVGAELVGKPSGSLWGVWQCNLAGGHPYIRGGRGYCCRYIFV